MQHSFYRQFIRLFFIGLILTAGFASLQPSQAQSIRPAEDVMQLQAHRDAQQALQLQWIIAPHVYMYRDKIAAKTTDGTPVAVDIAEGITKKDINFGHTEVLYNRAFAQIAADALPKEGALLISWQGCAEDSICYPPVTSSLDLKTLKLTEIASGFQQQNSQQVEKAATSLQPARAESVTAYLTSGFLMMLAAFFGFGLLLSLTPCVFPMIPILSAMLARSGDKLSAGRGFVLSSAYVIAMAVAYALLGFAASWSGYNLQAALQTPYALGFMAAIFTVLAFSMLGYFDLQLPSGWMNSINRPKSSNNNQKAGGITGALLLGFGSALIVGPCVTPPLAAALLYVAKTGDALRGASALFALGLGMGVPLIVFGTFGAKFLPKSGPWLTVIKQIFGVVFLGLAILMLLRLLSEENGLLLLALTALTASVFLGVFEKLPALSSPLRKLGKAISVILLIYGALLLTGFAGGATNPWQPLGFLNGSGGQNTPKSSLRSAVVVKTSADYDLALKAALVEEKPVIVDFTADWCTICKSNAAIMSSPEFTEHLGNVTMIVADITDYNDDSRKLMQRFDIVGPPTVMFLDAKTSDEHINNRVIGALTSQKLSEGLQAIGL